MTRLVKVTLNKALEGFDVEILAELIMEASKQQKIKLDHFEYGAEDESGDLFLSFITKDKPYAFYINFKGSLTNQSEVVFPLCPNNSKDSLAIEIALAASALLLGDVITVNTKNKDDLSLASGIVEEVMEKLKLPISKTASFDFYGDKRRKEMLYAGTIKKEIQLC